MEGHFDTHKIIAAAAKPTGLNWPMHRISSICDKPAAACAILKTALTQRLRISRQTGGKPRVIYAQTHANSECQTWHETLAVAKGPHPVAQIRVGLMPDTAITRELM